MGMCILAMGNQTAGQKSCTVFKKPTKPKADYRKEIGKKEMCALTIFLYI